jgi:hypothetical protein
MMAMTGMGQLRPLAIRSARGGSAPIPAITEFISEPETTAAASGTMSVAF